MLPPVTSDLSKCKPMRSSPALSVTDPNSHPSRMADALRNLQHAVDQCHDVVFITDAAGIISRVNPAFEKLTEYSALELVGKDLSLVAAGGALSYQYQQIRRRALGDQPYMCWLQVESKSGALVDLEATITPVRKNYGRVVSLVGTGHISVPSIRPKTDASPVSYQDPAVARLVHELRNVLMIVLARTDMATQVIDAGHPARPNLEDAKRAVLSAAALIRQFTNGESYGPATEVSGSGPQAPPVWQQSPAASLAAAQRHNAISRPATILLVEDESLLRESTREFLTSAGFHVLAAESAEEALASVVTNPEPIDLLIADRTLPGMSGSTLGEILTSASPATKVLLVSAIAKADLQTPPPFARMHFLAKPFLFSALHEEILSLLYEKKSALGVSPTP